MAEPLLAETPAQVPTSGTVNTPVLEATPVFMTQPSMDAANDEQITTKVIPGDFGTASPIPVDTPKGDSATIIRLAEKRTSPNSGGVAPTQLGNTNMQGVVSPQAKFIEAGLKARIAGLEKQVTDFTTLLQTERNKAAKEILEKTLNIEGELQKLRSLVQTLEQTLGQREEKITTLEQTIAALENKIATLTEALNQADALINHAKNNFFGQTTTTENAAGSLESTVDTSLQERRVVELFALLEGLGGVLRAAKTDINSLPQAHLDPEEGGIAPAETDPTLSPASMANNASSEAVSSGGQPAAEPAAASSLPEKQSAAGAVTGPEATTSNLEGDEEAKSVQAETALGAAVPVGTVTIAEQSPSPETIAVKESAILQDQPQAHEAVRPANLVSPLDAQAILFSSGLADATIEGVSGALSGPGFSAGRDLNLLSKDTVKAINDDLSKIAA